MLLRSMVRTNFLPMKVKKEKQNCADFVVIPQTVKVTLTMYGKYLVKMGETLCFFIYVQEKAV